VDRKTFAIVTTLVVAGNGSAWAQDTAAIKKALTRVAAGETISILDSSGRTETGILSGSTDTFITLDGGRKIAASQIARITVKDSTRNGTKLGAVIGASAGAAGALALGSLCANEGGSCAGAGLLLIGLGAGAGAGIGWLGDSLTQHEIYRAGRTPRLLTPEVRVRLGGNNRSGGTPEFGVSWSVTTGSGLGVEVNADRAPGASDGEGTGVSFDGRAVYTFGRSRVQPFVSGGVGYARHQYRTTYQVPPSAFVPNGATYARNQHVAGVVPVCGAGIRFQPARHLVIRPEVSWFLETAPNSANHAGVARAGVSIGAAW
jgi:hypothetical protein